MDNVPHELDILPDSLYRIHMYPDSTRIRALQLLMEQIASWSTGHLIKALQAWPEVEANLLLSEILACFDPIRFLIHCVDFLL